MLCGNLKPRIHHLMNLGLPPLPAASAAPSARQRAAAWVSRSARPHKAFDLTCGAVSVTIQP